MNESNTATERRGYNVDESRLDRDAPLVPDTRDKSCDDY